MKRTICTLLSVLALTSCGGGGGSDSGSGGLSTNQCSVIGLHPKIVNGTQCASESSSSVVSVSIISFADGTQGLCSGSMIAPNAVLTAAHCFSDNLSVVSVQVSGEDVTATKVYIHPGFHQDQTNQADFDDAAIVILSRSVSAPTLPIVTSRSVANGDTISIFGYGLDGSNQDSAGVLRSGQAEVSAVTSNHITTIFHGDGSNTCEGDSGGPAVQTVNGRAGIVGLTSSGTVEGCGDGDQTLFTNVQGSGVLNFIRSVVPSVGTI